jgi:hypothetical protein
MVIQSVVTATDLVPPKACDAANIDSHSRAAGRASGADATDVSTATESCHAITTAKAAAASVNAGFGGREQP